MIKHRWSSIFKINLFKLLLMPLLIYLAFTSCSFEVSVAKKYLKSHPEISVLILEPDYIFKTNLVVDEITGFDSFDNDTKDSLWYSTSRFLNNIDDSAFIINYMNSLKEELKLLGFKVYNQESIDTFMFVDSNAYILNIGQIEIEEYIKHLTESEIFDDTSLYYKSFKLNAVNVNSWFEINAINTSDIEGVVLFASETLVDNFKGRFRKNVWVGNIMYKYSLVPLSVFEIQNSSYFFGKKYAGYIFDYLLNAHISGKLPGYQGNLTYLHYNRQKQKLSRAYKDKFIVTEQ